MIIADQIYLCMQELVGEGMMRNRMFAESQNISSQDA